MHYKGALSTLGKLIERKLPRAKGGVVSLTEKEIEAIWKGRQAINNCLELGLDGKGD